MRTIKYEFSESCYYTRPVALRSRHKIQRARFTNTGIADLGFIRETLMDDIKGGNHLTIAGYINSGVACIVNKSRGTMRIFHQNVE